MRPAGAFQCPCGGWCKVKTLKGVDYSECKSCGRNDLPERWADALERLGIKELPLEAT